MGTTWSQFFPPTPSLTEKTLSDQSGRVFMVTGGASGVGRELSAMLYGAGAKVYIAGRSEANARDAIEAIRQSHPSSTGELDFLMLDLSDLASVRSAATAFKTKESRLHVLWNNAAVSLPPAGSTSAQGHELQMATNCLGPWLLTKLLLPLLREAAQHAPKDSVRVVFTSSFVVDLSAPKGGMSVADYTTPPKDQQKNYCSSKVGNWFLASEFGRAEAEAGVLSVTLNPGNLNTNLLRHVPWMRFMSRPLLYPARIGAYTELFAGIDASVMASGLYVIPWGRVHPSPRQDLLDALKMEDEGGSGRAAAFREWCDERIAEFI